MLYRDRRFRYCKEDYLNVKNNCLKKREIILEFCHLFKTPLSLSNGDSTDLLMKLDQPWCTRCTIKLITIYWYYANKK